MTTNRRNFVKIHTKNTYFPFIVQWRNTRKQILIKTFNCSAFLFILESIGLLLFSFIYNWCLIKWKVFKSRNWHGKHFLHLASSLFNLKQFYCQESNLGPLGIVLTKCLSTQPLFSTLLPFEWKHVLNCCFPGIEWINVLNKQFHTKLSYFRRFFAPFRPELLLWLEYH